MTGTRIILDDDDEEGPLCLRPGDYTFWKGAWYAMPPNTDLHANLAKHEVTLHDDGTITVSPSILVSDHKSTWHGYLEKGVWREC